MKVSDTRKLRAEELLRKLQRGPSIGKYIPSLDGDKQPHEWAMHHCQTWLQSWIVQEVIDLVPELRQAKKEGRL